MAARPTVITTSPTSPIISTPPAPQSSMSPRIYASPITPGDARPDDTHPDDQVSIFSFSDSLAGDRGWCCCWGGKDSSGAQEQEQERQLSNSRSEKPSRLLSPTSPINGYPTALTDARRQDHDRQLGNTGSERTSRFLSPTTSDHGYPTALLGSAPITETQSQTQSQTQPFTFPAKRP
ncbi:hypothetical protein EHS25_002470 [Saitozyma podzolica]|uniref:Uncharacterized protein n=1 Tax=Saitozyma podzolica TaxID=1890683 RepID=A0A427YE39_9TREE|nr:hypothetical protein EHS25_002470 [Saitozyma podzolica]